MAVSAKDLAALQNMWKGAKPQSDCSIPDGMYEFLIVDAQFKITASGIPQITTLLEVVGGNETFLHEKVKQFDNLQSPENMGWFKKKLARLGITIPEDVEEVTTRIPNEMKGKKLAGQLKSKDEFVNIYVNRLLGEVDMGNRQDGNEETSEEETTEEAAFTVGKQYQFTSVKGGEVEGELIELLDGDMARIKTAEGKVFKVSTAKLSEVVVAAEEETEAPAEEETSEEETAEETTEEEATEEEATEEESGGFPTAEEVKAMKLPELKKVLAENDMDINAIKNPRIFMTGMASFIYNAKYMPDLPTLIALRDGLKLKLIKNEKPGDMTKRVVAALHDRFEF
jgi:hypothetical protein